ncbi:MAG: 50S ribosomal protein L30e [Candidatus Bathyarchaeia archaeon]
MSKLSKSEIDKALSISVRSGKVLFGSNTAVKSALTGRARMIVVASNCPQTIHEKIEQYCKLSGIPLLIYPGSNIDLGSVCGKPFAVAALTVRDPGDSNILELVGGESV